VPLSKEYRAVISSCTKYNKNGNREIQILNLTYNCVRIKNLELIRGRKEVQDNLNLAYNSIRIEKIKKKVLAYQSITTS